MSRYERPHQMAQSTGIFTAYNRIPAPAKATLQDGEQMAALYAAYSMNQIAAHLHCSGGGGSLLPSDGEAARRRALDRQGGDGDCKRSITRTGADHGQG